MKGEMKGEREDCIHNKNLRPKQMVRYCVFGLHPSIDCPGHNFCHEWECVECSHYMNKFFPKELFEIE